MKLQKYSLLLLASVLFFSVTISVEASPNPQDAQDAIIRQVLSASKCNAQSNCSRRVFGMLVNSYGSCQ
jgi:hypothetical protein